MLMPAEPVKCGVEVKLPSPVEEINDHRIARYGVRLYLKRDDLIHPEIPGNKWRKLKYNLIAARERGYHTILTYGGAYSNHIRATAVAGYLFGFSTIGVIRGEEHLPLNYSLAYAVSRGMQLSYMDRVTYRHKDCPEVIAALRRDFGDFYLIPEGGGNALGAQGCIEITHEIGCPFDLICCSCGTGTTLAGIAAGLRDGQRALGFAALKGGQFLADEVEVLQRDTFGRNSNNWTIEYGFHFGGYAKITPELHSFIDDFKERHKIHLDWIYEAKMMYGLFALVQQRRIEDSVVVAIIAGPAEESSST
jgi:1-aminocyclopropane-1-carboxylate deaminase/D-cysteine desulfhydrase-like pyridoxal-dependent ACC family enzyme